MSDGNIDSGTGAALTATGPEDTKADSSVPHNSVVERLTPDEKLPTEGATLLDRVLAYTRRFICYPSREAGIAHVLWITHTHLMDAWYSTPRLAVLSPEPGSGKSRVLEITTLLVPNPMLSVNSSAAFIMRTIADQENRPTVLLDEIDAVFGPHARGNEDLRSMVNAGYRRGATIGRCSMDRGGNVLPERLATYAAVALGGLGDLPDTIMSRSVVIRMRKRAPGEVVEPFQPSVHETLGNTLRDELAAWAASIVKFAASTKPVLPPGIVDRMADVWGSLLTIAELAGGSWPELARQAASLAVQASKAGDRPSLGTQLLGDIRECFGNRDRLPTRDLLKYLLADDEAPWGDIRGRKIDARKLAELLRPYGIQSSTIRMTDGSTPKGYKRDVFHDSWGRYLPAPQRAATNATAATNLESPKKIEVSVGASESDKLPCGGEEVTLES